MSTGARKPITRTRELLACTECRRRKLRCDRNVPCSSCSRRGDDESCSYERFARGVAGERERRIQAEARLQRLEGLVQQLAASQDGSLDVAIKASTGEPQHVPSNGDELPPVVSDSLAYSGSTHWSAMLEDIEELRNAIAPTETDLTSAAFELSESDGTEFLFGAALPLTYDQILEQYLPPRQEADRLVAAYFRAHSIVAPFIHAAHFRRRYQRFWTDPQNAPPLWTSILFTICHIAETTVGTRQDRPNSRYSLASAQCLAVGRYYKPQQYAVEALLFFAQSKAFVVLDATSEMGMILSSTVRLATSSGYHRDPSSLNMSPFEQEMRRRTWSMCLQLDLLISFYLGLPSNVQFPTWDTQRPRNLVDSDFDETTLKLPPSRPDSEPTTMLFYIAKHRLMAVFEKILRHTISTGESTSDDIRGLNSELDETYLALPKILRPLPISDAIVDPPSLVITRLCVLFLYEKCRCVLHRKSASQGDATSVRICYEASSNLVRYFLDVFQDLQPGGQLESERWFNSTITWQDFLLAVMVLCVVLCVTSQGLAQVPVDCADSVALLKGSQAVCDAVSSQSKFTSRVRRLIDAAIVRFSNDGGVVGQMLAANGVHSAARSSMTEKDRSNGSSIAELDWTNDSMIAQATDDWFGLGGTMFAPVDDDSWTYLDQYLNLPSG